MLPTHVYDEFVMLQMKFLVLIPVKGIGQNTLVPIAVARFASSAGVTLPSVRSLLKIRLHIVESKLYAQRQHKVKHQHFLRNLRKRFEFN